jgi:competence protein ComEC
VLWPLPEHIEGTQGDVNNNAIGMRVRYGTQGVLRAGEVQEEGMQELLARPQELRADVVKVSHHGSRRMLPEFYAATGAGIALIPVGANTFGHPTAEALAALRSMRVLRTDRSGTVDVALDGVGGVTLREERRAPAA